MTSLFVLGAASLAALAAPAASIDAVGPSAPTTLLEGPVATIVDAQSRNVRIELIDEGQGVFSNLIAIDGRTYWFAYDPAPSDDAAQTGQASWTGISDDPSEGELRGTLAAYSQLPERDSVKFRWTWQGDQQIEIELESAQASGVFDSILPILRRATSFCRCAQGGASCSSTTACEQRQNCPATPLAKCVWRLGSLVPTTENPGGGFGVKKWTIPPE